MPRSIQMCWSMLQELVSTFHQVRHPRYFYILTLPSHTTPNMLNPNCHHLRDIIISTSSLLLSLPSTPFSFSPHCSGEQSLFRFPRQCHFTITEHQRLFPLPPHTKVVPFDIDLVTRGAMKITELTFLFTKTELDCCLALFYCNSHWKMVNYGYKKYMVSKNIQTIACRHTSSSLQRKLLYHYNQLGLLTQASSSLSIVFLADRRRARHGLPLIMLSKGLTIIFLSALTSVTILFQSFTCTFLFAELLLTEQFL